MQQLLVTKNYRMMGLSDCERISMICSAQSTRVTDGRGHGIYIRAIAYMLSRVKTKWNAEAYKHLSTHKNTQIKKTKNDSRVNQCY